MLPNSHSSPPQPRPQPAGAAPWHAQPEPCKRTCSACVRLGTPGMSSHVMWTHRLADLTSLHGCEVCNVYMYLEVSPSVLGQLDPLHHFPVQTVLQ